ncbi:MAG: RNA polymerase sigma factor FliA [Gammaproteobacteria bacterium]|nr:RNA polymerase sigma factor FliA [Gammaproteobacteria bacterium]MCW8986723.1 RNA polymerase sigma factor FliA [Gammaproteobacteria bacterium]MCW9030016.1 RNA polymerase sigma factor FliA [Gammaproteobacteria bacterium]
MYPIAEPTMADNLIEEHSGLVNKIAYHLAARLPASVVVDDLIQVGMIGLLDASQQYDPSQGAAFTTYATIRIRGAMLDELRRNDWAPKSVHKKHRDLMKVVSSIETRTGREAKPKDVAAEMGISLNEYFELIQESNTCRILSFVDLGTDDDSLHDHSNVSPLNPAEGLQKQQFREQLVTAIKILPKREKLIISLYYDEELNLREIGQVLDVSESRVSQLLGQAHLRMRKFITEKFPQMTE